MKKLFGVLYALYGCAWAALATRVPSGSVSQVVVALATACFVAAALAFFVSGWPWRIVQMIFGATTLAVCAAGWGWFLAYLLGFIRTVDMEAAGPLLGGFVAFVLTLPAVGYLWSVRRWRRARTAGLATPDRAQTE